jgi:PAS domain S-box-containing protein
VQREAENGLDFALKARFGLVIDVIASQLGLIRTLRGLTPDFGSFNDEEFDELLFERRLAGGTSLAAPECWYWIRKLQARFFAGDYASALDASLKAQRLLWTSPSHFEMAEYHFYGALCQAAVCDSASPDRRRQHVEALAGHSRQLEIWAEHCPENFETRATLVGAEIARIEGRELDAERLYEQAISSARANGFIHNEALAYELAARFYAARGFKQIADLYLRNARYGYLCWGALGKVRQLDEMYPDLRQEQSLPGPTNTIGAPVEQLDLATVIKVSQAVSSEIVLENLIDTLMHTAMEQAGAERALLIMPRGQEPRIEAEATTSGDTVTVRLVDESVTGRVLPESVLHYVLRTREIVILDDAAAQSPYGADSYIRQCRARSILCLPLLNQGKLIGVLYLENNMTPRVFAPTRISVLKLLASQAAIALENAHLYRDVAESETKIRRLVDSNIIGIFIWNFEGRILEANDEFLRMVGYDREDLVSGRVRWTDLTPPDWRERDNAKIEQHKISGRLEPFEKEYTRKDGSRVPVLIGVATFEEGGNEGVAFVLDLTERKRTEEKSRESELKLRQITETVPGLIWSTGPDGEPTHFNQRILDYSGMPSEAFMHGGWEGFVHPADYPETAEAFYHAIQTGTSYERVMRLRRADGEFRWHDARCEPLRDREGRIIQWYGLCVDINERKKVEDQLRRSEAYLAEAERLSHTGGWAMNRKGERTIVYWSEESYRIFGFDPLQGMPTRDRVWQQVHPDDRSRLREAADAALRQKRDYVAAFRILLPEGTIKYLESNAHHLFSADGELLGVVGTFVDITERKRAEQALRASEAKFRDFAETASDWFCEMGPDYKFTLLSENAFGSGAADRIGTACWDHALDLETEPEKWRILQETVFSRKPFRDFVYRGMSGNGSPMYVRASGKPLFDANGEFHGYRGTCSDVTEITHAQEALRESERSWRSAIDGIAGLVSIHFPNGEVETVNRQCLEYFGRSLEELRNWGTSDAVHPEDLPHILELFKRAIASGNSYHIDQRLRRFDGEYRWFTNRGVPIRDDSGHITRWYVLITDIEDRKRAEEALRSALDGIPGLVAILAPNGELETVNRQVFEYFGRSLEVLKNWGTSDLMHPEDLPRILDFFKRAIAAGIPFNFELRLRRSDGEYRWFENRHVPVRDDSGRIVRWYLLLMDIEDRIRALAQFEQMQSDFAHVNRVSMMGELAASLSHEITQPIGSARNNARAAMNFLDRNPPDLGEVREALGCVVGDTDRAGDIVDRIRDHIKKTPPRKRQFDLNEAINEAIVLGRSAIIKNGVSVQIRSSEGLFPIHCDRVQLQQVVLNLILNAAEAMGSVEAEPRDLVISTEQHHAGVLVAVRDSGPGLDPSHLERVFDAFYTTKSRGMGMGLSICRSIVDAHGGRLWAEANEPRGTIFKFTLPAKQVEL